jgi:large subunit ribosomal protein L25
MSATLAIRSTAKLVATGAARLARGKRLITTTTTTKPTTRTTTPKTPAQNLVSTSDLGIVSTLPQQLLNFFAKYPPEHYSGAARPSLMTLPPAMTEPVEPATGGAEAVAEAEVKAEATGAEVAEAVEATVAATEVVAELDAEKVVEAGSEAAGATEATETTITTTTTAVLDKLPSPYTPNRDAKGSKKPDPTLWSPSKALLQTSKEYPNPFLPVKNLKTGKWWSPKYSLRRQADLVKLAKKHGVEELLPIGRKSTIFKETRRMERGLAIKGTGIGQKVKGHKWERLMETKLEDRRKAMMEMPELIRSWKQVSLLKNFSSGDPQANCPYREDTDEDGRSGPSGSLLEPIFLVLFVQHICRRIIVFVSRRLIDGTWAKKRNCPQCP